MAEADAGLVIPIGFTEKKAAQQLARIEAQALKAANQSEKAFVKANQNITKSTQGMSGAVRGQVQNVSYQLQDVFVQIAGGTDATRALSQQLPQLASGFGVVGAVLGTVLAVALPLAATFIDLGDGSKELAAATKNAEETQKAYMAAVEASNAPMVELIARYGEAAGAAREMLNALAEIAELKNIEAAKAAVTALQERFEGLRGTVETYYNTLKSSDPLVAAGAGKWIDELNSKFGLTLENANEVLGILDQINATKDQNERNQLMAEMITILKESAASGADLNAEVIKLTEEAANAGLAVASINNADLSSAMGQVDALAARLGSLVAQANSAAAALNAAGVFVGSDGSIQTGARGRDPSTNWRFEDPNKDYDTIGERRAREAAEEAARKAREAKLLSGGGGGRKRGGGRGGRSEADKAEEERIKQVYEDLEVAIKAAEEQAEEFNDAMGEIGDTIADVIFEGENLRESLANIFKGIASDILSSGIKNALVSQFGAGAQAGGFGSFLGDLFGGFRANGGPVDPSKAYVVGEKGPEVFVPQTAGNIVPNHRMGGSYAPSTTINIQGNADERTLTQMRRELDMRDRRLAAQVPSIMDNHQKRRR
ncbi:hypothetical protein ACHFJ0_05050 [Paracoccus sp. NGMCC 1.201697]|uniref:Bacteriophage tail tape measure N-terminal domain-containing protein n=1 Tax=Paracoccus broussonetiae subsp. drimophilus TaxID=3373869 RepID=A0ABW7LGZ5_9RHOB